MPAILILWSSLYKKSSFTLRISSVNVTANLVTFTEEILNGFEQCFPGFIGVGRNMEDVVTTYFSHAKLEI